jgi:hypothetical protein
VRILLEFHRKTGHEHPNFRVVMVNYKVLLEAIWKTSKHIEQQLEELGEGLDAESTCDRDCYERLGATTHFPRAPSCEKLSQRRASLQESVPTED